MDEKNWVAYNTMWLYLYCYYNMVVTEKFDMLSSFDYHLLSNPIISRRNSTTACSSRSKESRGSDTRDYR
jgi:hypothetical protein